LFSVRGKIKMRHLKFTIFALILALPALDYAQIRRNRRPDLSTNQTRTFFPFRKKLTKEQKKQLEPKAEDSAKYAQFLAQPNTGIFRLLPDNDCEENAFVIKADASCLKSIPEGSFYSFREKEHTSETVADIRLKNGFLISDGILAQGILVKLEDSALERISLKSEGLNYLRDYQPPESSEKAHEQHIKLLRGIKVDKYEYRKAFSAVENTTYAMRVIAYRGKIIRSLNGYNYNILDGDKRMDLTLAFRVIRKEPDGSVTLLWKELEQRDSPKLKFTKNNKSKNEE